jgi:hypothetical protein
LVIALSRTAPSDREAFSRWFGTLSEERRLEYTEALLGQLADQPGNAPIVAHVDLRLARKVVGILRADFNDRKRRALAAV